MISRLIDRSIVRKLTVWSLSNICWFQLLKHDNLLLFFIFYGSKWRVLGFRTKEAFRRYYFGKFWWDIGWKYETIDGLIVNSLSKLYDMLLGCNDQSINWSIQSSFKQKCKLFGGSSFLNVRIRCCSWSMMTVSEESLSFGLLVGQKKQLDDVTLGNCNQHIFFFTDKLNESINC